MSSDRYGRSPHWHHNRYFNEVILERLGADRKMLSKMSIIHVAGDVGSGRAGLLISSILHAHSVATGKPLKVGMYNELSKSTQHQIQINGDSQSAYVSWVLACNVATEVIGINAQRIGVDTQSIGGPQAVAHRELVESLAAWKVFCDEKVDVVVIGYFCYDLEQAFNMGQASDMTVIADLSSKFLDRDAPMGSAYFSEDYERRAWLQSDIIRPGSAHVLAPIGDERISAILRASAETARAKLIEVDTTDTINPTSPDNDCRDLATDHQKRYLALAVKTVGCWLEDNDPGSSSLLTADHISKGYHDCTWSGGAIVYKAPKLEYYMNSCHESECVKQIVKEFAERYQLEAKPVSERKLSIISCDLTGSHTVEMLSSLIEVLVKEYKTPSINLILSPFEVSWRGSITGYTRPEKDLPPSWDALVCLPQPASHEELNQDPAELRELQIRSALRDKDLLDFIKIHRESTMTDAINAARVLVDEHCHNAVLAVGSDYLVNGMITYFATREKANFKIH